MTGCPALHVLAGTLYRTTPSGRLVPREPEHAVDPETGRCGHCHTTVITTIKRKARR
ncbi:hypothetical protein [Tessaracoccus palaemonis]|uniref:Uncharacterized protein n=1 Tax=Tessaracoccus palaemonis TaxID=2829499 RepID=A0ABX8SKR1_9ACTN|nr:hypothetical protein [Tessaracoccus palaemonis]QXT62733.1 hypothetical protein KDB89_13520 [Tessaracoccus palaemonis]